MSVARSAKKQQDRLVRTVGSRLRQSREMCNMSLTCAAKKLGYANSSRLSKVERTQDTHSVPLWLIERAAQLYDVSVDFLFGRHDDFETGSRMYLERETAQWVFHAWEVARQRDMQTVRGLIDRIERVGETTQQVHIVGEQLHQAMRRFVELNPEFESMRGGARVMAAVHGVHDYAQSARQQLSRFKLQCNAMNTVSRQQLLPGIDPIACT